MTKQEYFIQQIELIGRERLSGQASLSYNTQLNETNASFRYKDFTKNYKDNNELEKALGRQSKNRLLKLAGIVGWLDSWIPKIQKSKQINASIDFNPESEIIESPLFSNIPSSTTIYPLVSKVDYEDMPFVIYLSHTSKTLQHIYRTKGVVKNVIKYAKDCGLVQCIDESFRPRTWTETIDGVKHIIKARSKKYAVNTVVLVQLKDLMKKHGIVVPRNFNTSTKAAAKEEVCKLVHGNQELYYKVRLGKCMRTPGLSVEDVSKILSYKYQHILYPMLRRLEQYNKGRPSEQQMHFNFNVHIKNGYNIKNGCRCWSLAGLKPTEEKAMFSSKQKFEEYFKDFFGSSPWEYDVHSSVFRVNRGFNFGVWDKENEDAYAKMFPGVSRKVAKNISMLYMFEHSGKKIDASITRSCPQYTSKHKDEIDQVMRYWYGHVYNYIGETCGNLVFLLEDSFYSTVDIALIRHGYKFIRKFDCWAFPEDNHPGKEEMDKILEKCFKTWYETEAKPLKEHLSKVENLGVKELKKLYDFETTHTPTSIATTIYPLVSKVDIEHKEHMKTKPRKQESDIPDDWTLLTNTRKQATLASTSTYKTSNKNSSTSSSSQNTLDILQQYINKQYISRIEASRIILELKGHIRTYKESRHGWSIEDKYGEDGKPKPTRIAIAKYMLDSNKWTAKDAKMFLGI